uniref:ORF56 n=1 Tax=Human herpesvirus 3 TaxID=10335 RepID=A0A3G2KR04_HHV3|nr:ORF56 [Human alphaherpesvirus 3]
MKNPQKLAITFLPLYVIPTYTLCIKALYKNTHAGLLFSFLGFVLNTPAMSISGPPTTFILYRLHGVRRVLHWTLPDHEQTLYAFTGGSRSMAVKTDARCDTMSGGMIVLQHTHTVTLLTIDCSTDFSSYAFTHRDFHLQDKPHATFAMPFMSWVGSDPTSQLYSNVGGVLSVITEDDLSMCISIVIYGLRVNRPDDQTTPTPTPHQYTSQRRQPETNYPSSPQPAFFTSDDDVLSLILRDAANA